MANGASCRERVPCFVEQLKAALADAALAPLVLSGEPLQSQLQHLRAAAPAVICADEVATDE
jgi:hypothetical protein